MSIESIQFKLKERFAAPLPEFYQRRIIFWQDEDREFESTLDELDLPGVNIVKLTGTNNFAVKKLLLHDDLTGNYLIYNPFSYAAPQDDWLRDIELYSEEFRADYYSILMSELNINASPVMRRTVKLYATFFGNKERVARLRKIGREYQTPLQLHIDIMAVLAGLSGGSAQDVFIAVLSAGLDEESNAVLNNIQKFGNIEAFWQLVRKYTGFIHEDDKPLGFFTSHVLLTALAQTMNPSVLKGLERFISESNRAYCYSIVNEWRNREDNTALWDLCRTVEQELQLPSRFDKQEIETLLTGDIFRQSTRLIPDKDNIIPICDDDYFDDDITGRFVKWVEAVYGSDTLEENLKFIADALGSKGTPREVIRSYFLNDFYADHCKTYQKRPIYWLFDSGKKNGFKTLIYDRMFQRYGEATLTFRKVVDTVSQDHNLPSQAVEIALSQMMNEGLMVKRRHRTPRGNSINIVAPEWDKLIEAGLYKPES